MNRQQIKKLAYGIFSVLFWLFLWETAAVRLDEPIFLPRPGAVLETAGSLLKEPKTMQILFGSLLRIAKGFLLGTAAGIVCAALSSCSALFCALLRVPLKLIQTVPVASFVILLLLWVDATELSWVIAFMIVVPLVFENVSRGLREIDPALREASAVFGWKIAKKLRYLLLPAVLPYFLAACRAGLGMCFKAGVAAEIIGHARNSIGVQLYNAKLTLDTQALFAWTLLLLFTSVVFGFVVLLLLRLMKMCLIEPTVFAGGKKAAAKAFHAEDAFLAARGAEQGVVAAVENVTKSYSGKCVVPAVSAEFATGTVTLLQGVSGCGKTTFLRLLLGLEKPDAGNVRRTGAAGVCFQENRLCEWASAWKNVWLGGTKKSREEICCALEACGIDETSRQPVREFSGGMKRRVALLRALLNPGALCILDEPFHGLDEERKAQLAKWIIQKAKSAAVVLVTHDASEEQFFSECGLAIQFLCWEADGALVVKQKINSENREEKRRKIGENHELSENN